MNIVSILPYLVLVCIFASIVILITQYFSFKEEKILIKKRFIPKEKEVKKKFFSFKSLLQALAPINAHIGSKKIRENIDAKLLAAGSPLSIEEYFVFKELVILFLPLIVGTLVGWDTLVGNPMLLFALIGAAFIYPSFWLKAKAKKRKKRILRVIPTVIDLLILAVDAGLDFMVAVRRVVQRSQPGPMVDEISQMYHEVQMGCVRRDALRNMSKRLKLSEVDSFARTLIQAERMGTPMGEALRALADEIRIRQFQRGEQEALKAPIKMLFPLMFCILPVVLILVGGPVILQFMQSGISFK